MLLTIKQPTQHNYKSFHDYTPPTPPSTSRFSPAVSSTGPSYPPLASSTNKILPPLPAPTPSTQSTQQSMSTPHRGLPPPAAMTLPQPQQQQAPLGQPPLSQSMGQLPAPPQQWQGAEESMRNWLHAKAEEDKRKQEEEKTRQETLRLEQRKIEQDMLRTSLSGGIPPYMIPMVFAGMGGGNLPNASLEWAQHYMAQAHQQQQQIQVQQQQLLPSQAHTSPEQHGRRDSRAFAPSAAMTLPSTPIGPPNPQQSSGFVPSHPMSPGPRPRQLAQSQSGAMTRPPPTSHLPRLNTNEMHIQPPPAGPGAQPNPSGHPLQQTQTVQQESQSSPSIYFHHWQPPTTQTGTSSTNAPTTPSDQTTSSPRKRKATGPQQPAPPPTSQPQYTSPPFSQGSSSVSNTPGRRRGHSRQRSDVSNRGYDNYSRSSRRQTESFNLASPIDVSERSQGDAEPIRRPQSHSVSSMLQSDRESQSQSHQQIHASPRFSAGPEMRQSEQRGTPDVENARRGNVIKRDDA